MLLAATLRYVFYLLIWLCWVLAAAHEILNVHNGEWVLAAARGIFLLVTYELLVEACET